MPTKKEDLPGTLKRSPAKAQRTYQKTLDAAHEQYDSEEAAHRVAWDSVKHSYKKVGDHWEKKARKGPSDPQAARSGREARDRPVATGGGKDVGVTKKELYAKARRLRVPGRSRMSKEELTREVARRMP
jgi:cation transport regulator ChaB